MRFEWGDGVCWHHHLRVIRCFNIGTSCCTLFNHQYQHESWVPPALYSHAPPTGVFLLQFFSSHNYSSLCALQCHFFGNIIIMSLTWQLQIIVGKGFRYWTWKFSAQSVGIVFKFQDFLYYLVFSSTFFISLYYKFIVPYLCVVLQFFSFCHFSIINETSCKMLFVRKMYCRSYKS